MLLTISMNNLGKNINWREIVAGFSSYEGTLGNFFNSNHITKSQFYYYKKKLNNENNKLQFSCNFYERKKSKN